MGVGHRLESDLAHYEKVSLHLSGASASSALCGGPTLYRLSRLREVGTLSAKVIWFRPWLDAVRVDLDCDNLKSPTYTCQDCGNGRTRMSMLNLSLAAMGAV